MYDELVKRLRDMAQSDGNIKSNYIGLSLLQAADAIEKLSDRNVGKWIPVTERLPEEYTRVIGFMAWKSMTAIEYQNGKWYSIDHLEPLPDEAVTHWMPLPQPPKEE